MELLGSLELGAEAPDGSRVAGLSGLAWDADDRVLYAVSDEGMLLHFRPGFDSGRLTSVTHLATYTLNDADGRPLRGRHRDAEDLAVRQGHNGIEGDSELLVAFERVPRVVRYTPGGVLLETLELPRELSGVARYATPNQALEGLAIHPVYGIMVIPEASLTEDPPGVVSLFSLDGRRWSYPTAAETASSPTALEALPDGRLLVLERAFVSVLWPLVISLRLTDPGADADLQPTTLVRLDSSEGWLVDNFEALARHHCDRFFMLSDNNGRRYQKTLLVYFRLPGVADP